MSNSVVVDDPEVMLEGKRDGFDIRVVFQPPNSPDMNVLDLGYFRSIQTLQHQHPSNSTEELIATVKRSFEELPHIHKSHRRRDGETLRTLECPAEVWYPARKQWQTTEMDKENVG